MKPPICLWLLIMKSAGTAGYAGWNAPKGQSILHIQPLSGNKRPYYNRRPLYLFIQGAFSVFYYTEKASLFEFYGYLKNTQNEMLRLNFL